ncbi:PREDICTED: uncharacterized protein LOC108567016 [Nicrophorus vespilloides]|uniref:Uncharacterized protein LOC108567016 n=1 Tax=Nicrophorus vespilloides TaxID=110193 RepID=A0ABM1N787_NICVS|nr:PREDICTED: uncharacterized protein LOC108567016 [Nicrophorus vespilloides]
MMHRNQVIPALRRYQRSLLGIYKKVNLPEVVFPLTEPPDVSIITKLLSDCWELIKHIEMDQSEYLLKASFSMTRYASFVHYFGKIGCSFDKDVNTFFKTTMVSSEGMQGLMPVLRWEIDLIATYLHFVSRVITNSHIYKGNWSMMRKKHMAKLSLEHSFKGMKEKFRKLVEGFDKLIAGLDKAKKIRTRFLAEIDKAIVHINICSEDVFNNHSYVDEYFKVTLNPNERIKNILLDSLREEHTKAESSRSYCITNLTNLRPDIVREERSLAQLSNCLGIMQKHLVAFQNYKVPEVYKTLYSFDKFLHNVHKSIRVVGVTISRQPLARRA